MAIKSTIFKANLSIADIDHNYYADHNLTLARHPSETDERMMVRLVALALNAHQLQDLPALQQPLLHDLGDNLPAAAAAGADNTHIHWVFLGKFDTERIRNPVVTL